jgi:hypothetical protein
MTTRSEFTAPTIELLGNVEGHTIGGDGSSIEVGTFVAAPHTINDTERTPVDSETGYPSSAD